MRIVVDAGPLISMSNTCFLWLLEKLPFEFLLPPWVVNEVSLFPRHTKHYKLSALRIGDYIARGILKETALGEKGEKIAAKVQHIANNTYFVRNRPLKIIQRGEAEAIALATLTDHAMLVDERTIRLLIEDPLELKDLLRIRTGGRVKMDQENAEKLQEIVGDVLMLRSVDLVAYAHEEGILQRGKDFVEAAMYALKYAGCAVSEQEIVEYLSE